MEQNTLCNVEGDGYSQPLDSMEQFSIFRLIDLLV